MAQVQILNTVAASAADLTIGIGTVKVGGSSAPAIKYLDITRSSKNYKPATSVAEGGIASFQRSVFEQSQSTNVTFVAAANKTYKFSITQLVGLNLVSLPFAYTSDATGAAADIGGALVNAINASNLKVSASLASSTITIVADAVSNGGSATFTVAPISNILSANVVPTPNAKLALITGITPTGLVTFSGPHGFVTGQTIVIQGCTGAGAANVNDIAYQIEIPSANPTTKVQLVNCGTVGTITFGTAAGYLPGANPSGQYADVLAALVAAGSSSLPTAGTSYARLVLNYNGAQSPLINTDRQQVDEYVVYVAESVVSSVTAIGANYVTLESALKLTLAGKKSVSRAKSSIVATATSTTTDFGALIVGDYVMVTPVPAGTPANTTGSYFGTVATAGTLPFAAVVGSLYQVFGVTTEADANLISLAV